MRLTWRAATGFGAAAPAPGVLAAGMVPVSVATASAGAVQVTAMHQMGPQAGLRGSYAYPRAGRRSCRERDRTRPGPRPCQPVPGWRSRWTASR